MKTKLLKKVRKRFDIIHLPYGHMKGGKFYDYNLFKLVDNDATYFLYEWAQLGNNNKSKRWCENVFETEKECIDYLKSEIIRRLRNRWRKPHTKQVNLERKNKKIWFVK